MQIRRKWLERLYSAVCDDGVEYLSPVEDRWYEICVFSELANEWADRIFPLLFNDLSDHQPGSHVVATNCLLETERYDELDQILSICPYNFWHYDAYWAESLRRKGKVDDAIAFAKSRQLRDYERHAINEFCEQTLLGDGRTEEAHQQYGLENFDLHRFIGQNQSQLIALCRNTNALIPVNTTKIDHVFFIYRFHYLC